MTVGSPLPTPVELRLSTFHDGPTGKFGESVGEWLRSRRDLEIVASPVPAGTLVIRIPRLESQLIAGGRQVNYLLPFAWIEVDGRIAKAGTARGQCSEDGLSECVESATGQIAQVASRAVYTPRPGRVPIQMWLDTQSDSYSPQFRDDLVEALQGSGRFDIIVGGPPGTVTIVPGTLKKDDIGGRVSLTYTVVLESVGTPSSISGQCWGDALSTCVHTAADDISKAVSTLP